MENRTSGKLAAKQLQCVCLPKQTITYKSLKLSTVGLKPVQVQFSHEINSYAKCFLAFKSELEPICNDSFVKSEHFTETLAFIFDLAKYYLDIASSHQALTDAMAEEDNGGPDEQTAHAEEN